MALELLLLCLRALYFCMAAEKVGALLRMVLIVIKVRAAAGLCTHVSILLLKAIVHAYAPGRRRTVPCAQRFQKDWSKVPGPLRHIGCPGKRVTCPTPYLRKGGDAGDESVPHAGPDRHFRLLRPLLVAAIWGVAACVSISPEPHQLYLVHGRRTSLVWNEETVNMQSYLLCFICNLQDMRYFFLMLVFLLVCFGLTFSVLMSPISSDKLNLVSAVGSSTDGAVANSEVQVFGSLEVRCNVLQGLSAGAALAHGLLSAQLTCC